MHECLPFNPFNAESLAQFKNPDHPWTFDPKAFQQLSNHHQRTAAAFSAIATNQNALLGSTLTETLLQIGVNAALLHDYGKLLTPPDMYWATTNHLNAQRLSSFMSWHPQRSLVILGPKFTQENQLTTSLILFHHPEKHPKKIINAFTPLLEKQKLREFKILLAIFKAADGCASANEKRYGRESVASPEFTQNLLDQKLTKFDLDGVLNICQAVQAAYQAIEKLNLGFGTTPIPSEFNKEFH